MKIVEIFGNALLTGVSTWALLKTKSTFQFDTSSYSFFFSIGVTGLLATATNNIRIKRFTMSKSQNSLAFAKALLSTEICLLAEIGELLALSNLLFPFLNMVAENKYNDNILEAGKWYNAALISYASMKHGLKLGYVLHFMLLLAEPKFGQFSSYFMVATIMLAIPCLRSFKNIS